MADLYLASGDLLTGLTFGGHVYGAKGREAVAYLSGVRGAIIDQNVEAVQLAGSVSSFTYEKQGNNLVIYDAAGTVEVARVVLQDDANGTTIRFSDGAFLATVSPFGMKLGPIEINNGPASQLLDPNTGTPWAPSVETKIEPNVPAIVSGSEDSLITGKLNWTGASAGELPMFAETGGSVRMPGFFLETDGSFTLDTTVAAYQTLAKGSTQDVVNLITATDSRGQSVDLNLTIRVGGVDDAPYAENDIAFVVEAGVGANNSTFIGTRTASGNVLTNDNPIDAGDLVRAVNAIRYSDAEGTIGVDLVGKYGKVNVASDGTYTYTLNNADPDTQALAQGAHATDTFLYTIRDDTGSISPSFAELTIDITGTNDAPVAIDDSFTVLSGVTTLGLHVGVNDTDDDFSRLTYATVGAALAGVTLDAAGFATVDASVDAYKDLAPGAVERVVLSYMVTDQFGASDLGATTITVQGVSWA